MLNRELTWIARRQCGTIFEYPILLAILFLAGVILGPVHPAYYSFSALGVGALSAAHVFRLYGGARIGSAARARLKKFMTGNRATDIVLKAAFLEGGASLAVEVAAGRVAFIDAKGVTHRNMSDVKEIELVRQHVSQWGKASRTRYAIRFIFSEYDVRGLSFASKRCAKRRFAALRDKLGERITCRAGMEL